MRHPRSSLGRISAAQCAKVSTSLVMRVGAYPIQSQARTCLCHSNSDPSRERLETADAEVALLPLRERDASSMDLHQVHQLWQSSRALLESNRRLQNSESDQPRRENERGFSLYAAVANRVELEEVVDAAERASDAIVHGGARIERPSRSGVSGAYLIRNVTGTQNVLGIFKPFDEETAGTELPLQPAEAYFHPAEGAFKECAAYLLDHGHFANVPQTALAKCRFVERCGEEQTRKTKCGAFQVYYRNHGDAEDFGPGVFDTEAVQRIAAFDIRVLQCDRNASNVLVCDTAELLRHRGYWRESEMPEHGSERSSSRAQMQLVAIDHAYILPEQVPTVPSGMLDGLDPVSESRCRLGSSLRRRPRLFG
ncbi:Phosphatidylinositol 4-kinase type [Cyanidiococcus yangmingshanensis]|uniref:Phosphatidylinositol 4-kinase type n=1 Tax=Cyanidiococcus yangmingshanensis TaxID=2690220 RepID=A0A7J7IJY9_9RHOD|nr:Phosphatidylinositol 4-kinase type [Cyanidiococcus yangmingshanensis]